MAASAYLTYHDGKLEVPEELQRRWQLQEGDCLQVSPATGKVSSLLSYLTRNPKAIDWKVFEGILADSDIDLNADLEQERIRENALDLHLG